MIIAAEASGDMHAASLIRAIRDRNPSVHSFGIGGDLMAREGFEIFRELGEKGE